MITHIRVKNFKSWQDSDKVELAPLTGFFGTNSSGKSSLLQMLLLLKQTTERSDSEEVIFFGDGNSLVNLGNFREVIHGHDPEASLELEFGCKLPEPYLMDFSMKDGFPSRSELDNFNFRTVVSEEEENPIVEALSYVASDVRARIVWDKYGTRHKNHQFVNATPLEESDVENCYGTPVLKEKLRGEVLWSQKFLRQFSSAFEELFSYVYYLGPTRVNPLRRYQWEGRHPKHPGQWGNQAINALLSARVRDLKTAHDTEDIPIEQRVSYWLQEMDLAHSFSLNWVESMETTYEVRLRKTPSSPPVTLVDMGYGLSQFLPVLVLCHYVPVGSTLILEQPGIHLHPKVQSQLADLLIEVVTERNLQILVESHSEHLLTRLQLGIAEQKIAASETALYFCENDNGVSTVKSLDVDELGNIKNWPKDFFGNVRGDLVKMAREQMKRQKKAEDE